MSARRVIDVGLFAVCESVRVLRGCVPQPEVVITDPLILSERLELADIRIGMRVVVVGRHSAPSAGIEPAEHLGF